MVPPLSNTFAPPIASVTSGLVDNLINNNPQPTLLSSQRTDTTVTPSLISPQSSITTESNANQSTTSAIDNLTTQASNQLYISQPIIQPPTEQTQNQQNAIQSNAIQPPSMIPAAYLSQPQSVDVNQQFVQSEGEWIN
jgi:hypothetical protein